jgi:hypothetical protein
MAVWGSNGHGDAVPTVMHVLVRYGLRWGVMVVSVCAWVHVFQVAEAKHWPTRSRRGVAWPTVRSGGRERPEEGKKLTVGGVKTGWRCRVDSRPCSSGVAMQCHAEPHQ